MKQRTQVKFETVYHVDGVILVDISCPACWVHLQASGTYGHKYEVVLFGEIAKCPHCHTVFESPIEPYPRTALEWWKLADAQESVDIRDCMREEMTKARHTPSNMRGKSSSGKTRRRERPKFQPNNVYAEGA